MYEHEAEKKGIKVKTFVQELAEADRAVLDGETDGFVKVHVQEGTDKILGATIVASHAGDLISEITTAMKAGLGLGSIASVIHPYPTQAAAIKKVGDAYNRTRLTPFTKRLFERLARLAPLSSTRRDFSSGASAAARNGFASFVMSRLGSSFLPRPSHTIIETLSTV